MNPKQDLQKDNSQYASVDRASLRRPCPQSQSGAVERENQLSPGMSFLVSYSRIQVK